MINISYVCCCMCVNLCSSDIEMIVCISCVGCVVGELLSVLGVLNICCVYRCVVVLRFNDMGLCVIWDLPMCCIHSCVDCVYVMCVDVRLLCDSCVSDVCY